MQAARWSGRRQGQRHHCLDSSSTWAIWQVSPSRSGRCGALSSSFLHPIIVAHCRLCGPCVAIKHCVIVLRHNTCSHSCSHQCTLEQLHSCMERPSLAFPFFIVDHTPNASSRERLVTWVNSAVLHSIGGSASRVTSSVERWVLSIFLGSTPLRSRPPT